MYYHYSILLLFGPFIKLRILGSSLNPYEICVQAADAIASLLRSYRQLYGLRRIPSFVSYIVLASGIMQLVAADSASSTSQHAEAASSNLNVEAFTHILQATTNFNEMIPSNTFARRAKQIFRHLVHTRRGVNITRGLEPAVGDDICFSNLTRRGSNHFSKGEAVANSATTTLNHHSESFSKDSIHFFSTDMEKIGCLRHDLLEISIFSPFPMQVFPARGLERELEQDGFELIT